MKWCRKEVKLCLPVSGEHEDRWLAKSAKLTDFIHSPCSLVTSSLSCNFLHVLTLSSFASLTEQVKRRSCSHPSPKYGGQHCFGSDFHLRNCTGGMCRKLGKYYERDLLHNISSCLSSFVRLRKRHRSKSLRRRERYLLHLHLPIFLLSSSSSSFHLRSHLLLFVSSHKSTKDTTLVEKVCMQCIHSWILQSRCIISCYSLPWKRNPYLLDLSLYSKSPLPLLRL